MIQLRIYSLSAAAVSKRTMRGLTEWLRVHSEMEDDDRCCVSLVVTLLFSNCVVPKDFLRSIDDIKEPILVSLPLIQVPKSHGDRSHRPLIHQEEKSLIRMQLKSSADDFNQFSDRNMIRNQKFCPVQKWQLFLPMKPFNDYWHFIWVQLSDLLNILFPLGCFSWDMFMINRLICIQIRIC